jgi:hypothetical protein
MYYSEKGKSKLKKRKVFFCEKKKRKLGTPPEQFIPGPAGSVP